MNGEELTLAEARELTVAMVQRTNALVQRTNALEQRTKTGERRLLDVLSKQPNELDAKIVAAVIIGSLADMMHAKRLQPDMR